MTRVPAPVDCGGAEGPAQAAGARHHGEPSSPFERRARLASRQRFNCPPTQPPMGDGGLERVEPGASYGDRRAVRAHAVGLDPALGATAAHEGQ